MLICVYGEDGFRVSQKVSQLKEQFRQKFDSVGFNISEFETKAPAGEVMSAMRSGGLLSQKRMVVINGLVEAVKKVDVEMWAPALCSTDSDAIVVLRDDLSIESLGRQPLWLALKDAADRHDYSFGKLSSCDLERWVAHELKEMGAGISRDALRHLVANTCGDTWLLHQEMSKLSAYAKGRTISSEDVAKLVHALFEDGMFAFIDAVSQRRAEDAIRLLERERERGASDGHLLAMLLRQVRILIGARSLLDGNQSISKAEVAKELSVHPFVAQKALDQARRYRLAELIATHDLLFELDQKIKQGEDPGLAVEKAIRQMLK